MRTLMTSRPRTLRMSAGTADERLSLGLDPLDDHLGGGPRPGTLVSLTAPPASQAGTLFYALMRQRPTLYVTTLRREDAVRDELEHVLDDDVEYTIRSVGKKNPLRNVNRAIEAADESGTAGRKRNIVIDTMNPLERTGKHDRYIDLLNAIKSYLLEAGGVAMCLCTELERQPTLRDVTLTISDLVLDLGVVADKSTVENHLIVPKFRSRDVVEEVIKLKLGREALVDTSRNL